MTNETDFAAKEPALGYYYQIRYGLYLLLKNKDIDDIQFTLEQLDDIVLLDANSINLYQTKLHIKTKANLTNSSPDLWKTIRVWSDAIKNKLIDPAKTIFTLITTAKASQNSVTYEMCKSSALRDNQLILETLEEITEKSNNKENINAYNIFNSLANEQKKALIKNLQLLDSSLDIKEVKQNILNELRLSTTPKLLNPFFERLEGWWFDKCINILLQNDKYISFADLQEKIYAIQDLFKSDNLPVDFLEKIHVNDKEVDEDNRTFVRQLKLISIGKNLIKNSISDYYRAYEQRSKWIRQDLINPDEEIRYDSELVDYWEPKYSLMLDEIDASEDKSENRCINIGKSFYENFYVKATPQSYIRDRVKHEFLSRGSSHMLSDKKRIGWHPYYHKKLET